MKREIPTEQIVKIIILLVVITFIILILMVILRVLGGVADFKSSCESFGGHYWEIANVTCRVGAMNCMHMCILNGERFSMSDLGEFGLFTYSKQICIKDCAYINKQAGEFRCAC